MTNQPTPGAAPPSPAPAPDPNALPRPLTFFLSGAERKAVLRALRATHTDRRLALLRALSIADAQTS